MTVMMPVAVMMPMTVMNIMTMTMKTIMKYKQTVFCRVTLMACCKPTTPHWTVRTA